jgi:hypothetical protein
MQFEKLSGGVANNPCRALEKGNASRIGTFARCHVAVEQIVGRERRERVS